MKRFAATAAFGLAFVTSAFAQETRVYRFKVDGTTIERGTYQGEAEVKINKSSCSITWRTPEVSRGFCMEYENYFVVSYRSGKRRGIVLYSTDVNKRDGVFRGVWNVDGVAGFGTETLTPIVKATAAAATVPTAQGTQAGAQQLLLQFFDPKKDRAMLTASLRPSPAEVRAVYGEPLASGLDGYLERMFKPGEVIAPQAGHSELLTTITTTGALRAQGPNPSGFPQGYEQVRQYIVGDMPIVRFSFVAKGESLGLAFDGLVFVNNRWVLIPKPWRALQGP
jgi:hypothetical protein